MAANHNGKGKKVLTLVGISLVLLLGAYGFGRWQGAESARRGFEPTEVRSGLPDLGARDARGDQAAADLVRLEGETQTLRAQIRLLQARRHLHLALMALDERNFGTAREHLGAAGKELETLPSAPTGTDAAALSRLAQELSSTQVTAGDNLATHRQRILAWVRELEGQLPAEGETAPSSDEPSGTEASESTPATNAAPRAAPGAGR